MISARDEILRRIRDAVAHESDGTYETIGRGYDTAGGLDAEARLELFEDRLRDYGAGVYRASDGQIADRVAEVLRVRRKNALLTPQAVSPDWLPGGFAFSADTMLPYAELDRSEGVLTGCALAIAATGTIVLRHTAPEGRRALTLIPDYHLCVVFSGQVVETVVEGFRRMAEWAAVPLTTVSGPSATSDIEMTRIQGVHGPRTLDVITVE